MSWAAFPTKWYRAPTEPTVWTPENNPGIDAPPNGGLALFGWRKDGSSSMSGLMTLIALALELRMAELKATGSRRGDKLADRPQSIAVTLDRLQAMTGFARRGVVSGIDILQEAGAIAATKVGRSNHYELLDLRSDGSWCQLPVAALLAKDGRLRIRELPRKRASLDALKVYYALLAGRDTKRNTAAMSWTGLQRRTGIGKRERIGPAITILVAEQLIRDTLADDDRRMEDRSRRYLITGLHRY